MKTPTIYTLGAGTCRNGDDGVVRMALHPQIPTVPTDEARSHRVPFRVVYRHADGIRWYRSCASQRVSKHMEGRGFVDSIAAFRDIADPADPDERAAYSEALAIRWLLEGER